MAVRVGAESKPKLYAAIGLGALLVILAIIQIPKLIGGSSPAPVTPLPVAPRPVTANPAPAAQTTNAFPHEATQLPSASALDPTLHPELMAQAEDTTYKGNGRNIFSPDSAAPVDIPKPNAPIRPGPPPPPPGPPPPPTIDLKFYGYSSVHGGSKEIFLLHGDDIFLAHEGDIVDRRYRVVAIRPFAVEIEDIPYHNTQSLPLSQN
ncbi:MAG TPA: hypothetical protein VF126_01410 [Acidobacteriaceae bacterium]